MQQTYDKSLSLRPQMGADHLIIIRVHQWLCQSIQQRLTRQQVLSTASHQKEPLSPEAPEQIKQQTETVATSEFTYTSKSKKKPLQKPP